jgi:hypothetical protein
MQLTAWLYFYLKLDQIIKIVLIFYNLHLNTYTQYKYVNYYDFLLVNYYYFRQINYY